jgi:hypothetical protein
MKEAPLRSFGLIIAYVLPGFMALWGASFVSETVRSWLDASAQGATVGGFAYATLAAIGAGMTANAVRWVLLDRLHHWTGVREPRWDFSRFAVRAAAFDRLVENHYRYYQSYGASLVAVTFSYALWKQSVGSSLLRPGWSDVGLLVVAAVLFAGSRDALRKYYTRAEQLLALSERRSTHDERLPPRDGQWQRVCEGKTEQVQAPEIKRVRFGPPGTYSTRLPRPADALDRYRAGSAVPKAAKRAPKNPPKADDSTGES